MAAASAATRAALLGLALLVLQRSPAGALSDISPERAVRGGHASTNRTPAAESQPHHNHHQHGVSGGHRGSHVQPPQEPYRPHKKFSSSPEGHEGGDILEMASIKKPRRGEEVSSSPVVSGDIDTNVDMNNNEGGSVVVPSASVGLNGAATPFLGSGHSSTVLNMPPGPGTYIPSNCSTCRIREELRNLSLQAIKEQILNKLGMKHAPNTTGRAIPKIPPIHRLLDRYGMQSDQPDRVFQPGPVIHEEEDDYHAKTTMVIAVAQTTKLRHGGGIGNDLDIQHFRFSERSIRNKVSEASMFIYVPVTSRPVRVLVYRVVGNATEHESMTVLLVAASKLSEQRKPSWVELDANKLLIDWFKNPRDNLGVVVKIEDDTGLSIPYTVESDSKEESKQPFVRVHTTDGKKKRNKRTIGLNCHENSQETRCCRYTLTVDFEEFGWDWIIAPKKYDANYCSGECPYVFLQRYPHTHIVQQANPAGTAGPCCAPRKMSPISMLYFDNEFNIIYGLLPSMVVERCGCQ